MELKAGDHVRVRPARGHGETRSGEILAVVLTSGTALPFYKVRFENGLEALTPFGPDVAVEKITSQEESR